ncbi:MAG: hypothetical protein F6K50_03995 [Moorea sp. SIO3I7]|nr:hypothetical protein [Moorena sp. SIO3I7]
MNIATCNGTKVLVPQSGLTFDQIREIRIWSTSPGVIGRVSIPCNQKKPIEIEKDKDLIKTFQAKWLEITGPELSIEIPEQAPAAKAVDSEAQQEVDTNLGLHPIDPQSSQQGGQPSEQGNPQVKEPLNAKSEVKLKKQKADTSSVTGKALKEWLASQEFEVAVSEIKEKYKLPGDVDVDSIYTFQLKGKELMLVPELANLFNTQFPVLTQVKVGKMKKNEFIVWAEGQGSNEKILKLRNEAGTQNVRFYQYVTIGRKYLLHPCLISDFEEFISNSIQEEVPETEAVESLVTISTAGLPNKDIQELVTSTETLNLIKMTRDRLKIPTSDRILIWNFKDRTIQLLNDSTLLGVIKAGLDYIRKKSALKPVLKRVDTSHSTRKDIENWLANPEVKEAIAVLINQHQLSSVSELAAYESQLNDLMLCEELMPLYDKYFPSLVRVDINKIDEGAIAEWLLSLAHSKEVSKLKKDLGCQEIRYVYYSAKNIDLFVHPSLSAKAETFRFDQIPANFRPMIDGYLTLSKIELVEVSGELEMLSTSKDFREDFKRCIRDTARNIILELCNKNNPVYIDCQGICWCAPELAEAYLELTKSVIAPSVEPEPEPEVIELEAAIPESQQDQDPVVQPKSSQIVLFKDDVIDAEVVETLEPSREQIIQGIEAHFSREYHFSKKALPKTDNFPMEDIKPEDHSLFTAYMIKGGGMAWSRAIAMAEMVDREAVFTGNITTTMSVHFKVYEDFQKWAIKFLNKINYYCLDSVLRESGAATRQSFCQYAVTDEAIKLRLKLAGAYDLEPKHMIFCVDESTGERDDLAVWENVRSFDYSVKIPSEVRKHFLKWINAKLNTYYFLDQLIDDFDITADHFKTFNGTTEAVELRKEIILTEGIEAVIWFENDNAELHPDYKEAFVAWIKELPQPKDLSEEPVGDLLDMGSYSQLFTDLDAEVETPNTKQQNNQSEPPTGKDCTPNIDPPNTENHQVTIGEALGTPDITETLELSKPASGPFSVIDDLSQQAANHDGYFVGLKQLCVIVNDRLKELGSSIVATVRSINELLVEFGWQVRENSKWVVTPEHRSKRKGNQWHTCVVNEVADGLSVVYITAKDLLQQVRNVLERQDITANGLSKALANLSLQNRINSEKGYKVWVPGKKAIAKDGTVLVKAKGSRVVYHPGLVEILDDNNLLSFANPKKKTTKSASKSGSESFGMRFAIAALGKAAEISNLLLQVTKSLAQQAESFLQQEVNPQPKASAYQPIEVSHPPEGFLPLSPENHCSLVLPKSETAFVEWLTSEEGQAVITAIAGVNNWDKKTTHEKCLIKSESGEWWIHPELLAAFDSSCYVPGQLGGNRHLSPWEKGQSLIPIGCEEEDFEPEEYTSDYYRAIPIWYWPLIKEWKKQDEEEINRIVSKYWKRCFVKNGEENLKDEPARFEDHVLEWMTWKGGRYIMILPALLRRFDIFVEDAAIVLPEEKPVTLSEDKGSTFFRRDVAYSPEKGEHSFLEWFHNQSHEANPRKWDEYEEVWYREERVSAATYDLGTDLIFVSDYMRTGYRNWNRWTEDGFQRDDFNEDQKQKAIKNSHELREWLKNRTH